MATTSTPRVIVLGNSNVDLTSYVTRVPDEGETVLANDFQTGMGGKGANQAVAAARAGSASAFIGRIGSDSFGDFTWDQLRAEGLSLTHLSRVDEPTGVASIYVDQRGANRIIVFLGASATLSVEDVRRAVLAHPEGNVFVSQLEIDQGLVLEGLTQAKSLGMTTVLNTAPYHPLRPGIVEHTDWLIANEGETAALLAERGLEADTEAGLSDLATEIPHWAELIGVDLIVTLGDRGALGCRRGEAPYFAEAPAVSAVDTVGAGDCLVGYFVALLDQGAPWRGALSAAVHAASHSVQRPGAQASYPPLAEADTFRSIASKPTND